MCSISGFLRTYKAKDEHFHEVLDIMDAIIQNATDRGRDSSGLTMFRPNYDITPREIKILSKYNHHLKRRMEIETLSPHRCLINNNRAEPTTEYVQVKKFTDVQPFHSDRWWVAHNGIICNDAEFASRWELNTDIDTAIIPYLIEEEGMTWDVLQQLKGSMALAIVDKMDPEAVYLYRDYKPLYVMYHYELATWFFTSLPKYFPFSTYDPKVKIMEVPAFSLCSLDAQDGFKIITRKPEPTDKKAIVVCSGGLDSTTAAKQAQLDGYEIHLVHMTYGCQAEKREMEAIAKIGRELDCTWEFVEVGWLKQLGGSSLTNGGEIKSGETGAEYCHEWVPARNLIFLSMCAAISEVRGASKIYMGLNLEEGGAYPDNTVEFYENCNRALIYGTLNQVQVVNPLGNLMKWEIVKMALEIDAPIHLSWSCYKGGEKPCGNCGPCYMRKKAFKMNKIEDMIEYEQ